MSDYILYNKISCKTLIGKMIDIPLNSEISCKNGILEYKGLPICFENSAFCKNNFVYNMDGEGVERLSYLSYILFSPRDAKWKTLVEVKDDIGTVVNLKEGVNVARFSPSEKRYIKTKYPQYIKKGDIFDFNNDFYKAKVSDLKEIHSYLVMNETY